MSTPFLRRQCWPIVEKMMPAMRMLRLSNIIGGTAFIVTVCLSDPDMRVEVVYVGRSFDPV